MRKEENMENEQDKGWSQPYHQKRGDKNQELRREKDLQMLDEKEERL
jgi:hypothetical protein